MGGKMKQSIGLLLISMVLMFVVTGVMAKGGKKGENKGKKDNAGQPMKKRVDLEAVGSDSDAKGFAEISSNPNKKKSQQSLHIKVEKVDGNTDYTIVIDGNEIDTFKTTPGGTFQAIYETDAKGSHRELPEELDPVTDIKLIEIKVKDGDTVLEGDFDATDDGDDDSDSDDDSDGDDDSDSDDDDDGDGDGGAIEKNIKLNPTGVDADAKGEVEIEIETENGTTKAELEIEVENLAATTPFKIFVDGSELGGFTTDATGRAKVIFSSNPQTGELPLPTGLDLNTAMLFEIKGADGMVVLTSATVAPPTSNTLTLTSTGVVMNAAGQAILSTTDNTFSVTVSSMTPATVFLVKVDGKLAGAINTDSAGAGKLDLAASPSSGKLQLPSSITLSTAKLVEISNETGAVVLTGMFQ
jgi:hypothetical protein